ncbi:MAG: ATP synthase F0 subunit B [Deltaproteobacteria bacterium]|nr:ATP synthase F0 subunit B [Deltaproteobacteria bacterium]
MKRAASALALATLLAPAAAYASAPVGEELVDIALKGLNLLLVFGLIAWYGREPIRRFFSDRRQTISHDLGHAAKLLEDAELKYAEWERRMAGIDGDLAEIRRQASERADAERRRILAEAEASAQRIRRDAEAAAEQEIRRARAELQAEAADLAVRLAGQLVTARMTPADAERLLDEFVTKLGTAPPAARGGA